MKTQVEEVGRLNDDKINVSRDIEKLEYVHDEHSVYNEDIAPAELSTDHYEFLMKRHGSVQLDPLPSNDPLDPLNWQEWKKNYEIILIAFHCFVVTFMAAGLAPAYEAMSIQYGFNDRNFLLYVSANFVHGRSTTFICSIDEHIRTETFFDVFNFGLLRVEYWGRIL